MNKISEIDIRIKEIEKVNSYSSETRSNRSPFSSSAYLTDRIKSQTTPLRVEPQERRKTPRGWKCSADLLSHRRNQTFCYQGKADLDPDEPPRLQDIHFQRLFLVK